MKYKISDSHSPATTERIASFQMTFNVVLPTEYKQFLQATNGGRPVPYCIHIPEWPGQRTCIHFFFGLHDDEDNSLKAWTEELHDELPSGCIPIGVDMGGHFLVLATEGERRGQVYYWDASTDYDLSPDVDTLFLVAENMLALLESLEQPPEPSE